jgi:hypothetical protein
MEIDPQNDKELVAEIVQKLKDVNSELTACKLSFAALKSQCSDLEQRLEAAARSSSRLPRTPHEKYDTSLEKLPEQFDGATSDWILLQRLCAWNVWEPVN